MPMKVKLILLLLCPLICSFTEATKGGYRVRVLRTHEDKVRYLNSSQIAKENFFFGMRPILYVSRYSPCNCPTAAETDTPSPSGSILDLPDFPPEDEVIPPSGSSSHPQTPRIQDNNQGLPHDFLPSYHAVPLPGSSKSKETNKSKHHHLEHHSLYPPTLSSSRHYSQ